jgi:uncharacterized protein YsxB (DUF464 family)
LISIRREDGYITIKGHAGYAPIGQDIVCAAVSALVQTFLVSVEELTADEITAHRNEQGQIETIQYRKLSEGAQLLLASFFVGIRMIADSYPSNIELSEHL